MVCFFFYYVWVFFPLAVFFASPVKPQPVNPTTTTTDSSSSFILSLAPFPNSVFSLLVLPSHLAVTRSSRSSRLALPSRGDRSAAEHRHAGLVHRRRERRRAAAAGAADPLLHQEEQRRQVFR